MEESSTSKEQRDKERKWGKDRPNYLDPVEEEIQEEILSEVADKYNVSRRIGKSLVKQVISEPSTIAWLKIAAGLTDKVDCEIPEEKFTRSKAKVDVPLKPIEISKLGGRAPNFLFADDFGNEDDDTDFVVDENETEVSTSSTDESSVEYEEEEIEEDFTVKENEVFEERLPWNLNSIKPINDVNLNSLAVHNELEEEDELFRQWTVSTIQQDWARIDEFLCEENDPDFNYEKEVEEVDEESDKLENFTTKTAMPKREVKQLLAEAYDFDVLALKEEKERMRENFRRSKRIRRSQGTVKEAPMPIDQSCSLLSKNRIIFKDDELTTLKYQLEQHVQYLMQNIVLCHHDERRRTIVGANQTMFNEINDFDWEAREQKKQSMFIVDNIADAIVTLHDVAGITKVPNLLINWQNAPAFAGFLPRPEACLALSRSKAILYPYHVPIVQPHNKRLLNAKWTKCEESLLLLGIMQFGYVKNSSQNHSDGRYYQIHRNLLPGRTPQQICNHLATIRKNPLPNDLQKLILKAEDENPVFSFSAETIRIAYGTPMDAWAAELKPIWYEPFKKLFQVSGNEIMFTGGRQNNLLSSLPANTSIVIPNNAVLLIQDQNGKTQPIDLNAKAVYLIGSPGLPIPFLSIEDTSSTSIEEEEEIEKKAETSSTLVATCSKATQPNVIIEVPEPEVVVDIETIPSSETSSQTNQKPTNITNVEAENISIFGQSQIQELKLQTSGNKRKQKTPVKYIPMVRRRKKQPVEDSPRKKLQQLKEELTISSSSEEESSNSPKKVLQPVLPVISPQVTPQKKKRRGETVYHFQETTSDMPGIFSMEMMTECSNTFIPVTPRARTPSDCSISSVSEMNIEITSTQSSEFSPPSTPRDDNFTCSPTLMRVDSVMADRLLDKVKVTTKKRLFTGPTDFSTLVEETSNEEKELPIADESITLEEDVTEAKNEEETMECDPSTSQPQPMITVSQRKWKKRTRGEKAQDGLDGMNDSEYRKRQENILCKHIFNDIKKRLALRRDLYSAIQIIFRENSDPTKIVNKAYNLLHEAHPEVFSLLACLFPEDILPLHTHMDPMRKCYREALDMIMAIDAYTMRARYKNSKTSKLLFRLVLSFCTEELNAEEFCGKMKELFQDAPPLWEFLKTKLPMLSDKPVDQIHTELIDLTTPLPEDIHVETVDFAKIMGPVPSKRRNKIHIHNGNIFVNTGSSYVLADVIVEQPKFTAPVGRAPQSKTQTKKTITTKKSTPVKKAVELKWTKELDLKVISAYNAIDDDNAVLDSLVPILPFSREKIADRLNFLLAQFNK